MSTWTSGWIKHYKNGMAEAKTTSTVRRKFNRVQLSCRLTTQLTRMPRSHAQTHKTWGTACQRMRASETEIEWRINCENSSLSRKEKAAQQNLLHFVWVWSVMMMIIAVENGAQNFFRLFFRRTANILCMTHVVYIIYPQNKRFASFEPQRQIY